MAVSREVRLVPPWGFGALLKQYRVAAGLTQEGLAELAGLSTRGISDLERGVAARPQRETLAALLAAMPLSSWDRARLEAAAGHPAASALRAVSAPRAADQEIPLVSRARELAIIERHLAGEAPPVLALAGEPGIGKSRLLQEGGRLAAAQGYTVLRGDAHHRRGQDPYAPILDVLVRSVHGSSLARLRAALAGCGWLVRLLPELAELVNAPVPAGMQTPEGERRLVFAAAVRYISNLAGPAGALLVLDDLQWAGPDGLDLLVSLLEPPADPPIRVLCAYRDTEVGSDHPLAATLGYLGERRLVEHVPLAPLPPEDALDLLDGLLSSGEAADVALRQQIVERTGGVPFFLVSCARWLDEGPDGAARSLPWNVAQSIRQRVAALSVEARMVLQAAAVVGRVVPRSTLRSVVDAPEQATLAGLDAACRSRLLLLEGRGAYRFAHDVIRESIEADLDESARVLLHRRVGETLEQLPEVKRTARAAEIAWHFLEGDDLSRALLHFLKAGDQARLVLAHEEAERQYQMAVQLAEGAHDEHRKAEAQEKLGTLYWKLGRYEGALAVLDEALTTYGALADFDDVGRVAGKLGWVHSHGGTGEAGIARLERLATELEQAGSPRALAEVYGALTHLYIRQGSPHKVIAAGERAAAAAELVADDAVRITGGLNRALAVLWRGCSDDALEGLQRVISGAEELQETETLFRALQWAAHIESSKGSLERAQAYVERAVEVTQRATSPSFHITALGTLSTLLFYRGDWSAAREHGHRALQLEPPASSWAAGDVHLVLAQQALAEGRWDDAAAHLDEAEGIFERTGQAMRPAIDLLLAHKDLLDGKPTLALARLEPLQSVLDSKGHQLLTEALSESGDIVQATAMAEAGTREARAAGQRMVLQSWLRLEGMVLTHAARWEHSKAVLQEGLRVARDIPCPYEEGRILFEMGRMHAARGERSSARANFQEGLSVFQRLGARPYIERSVEALRQLG